MEAVLPLRVTGGYSSLDAQRAGILIQSLDRFWIGHRKLPLWIVVTNDALDMMASLPPYQRIAPRVIRERDLIKEFSDFADAPGWFKQQLIKLAAHSIVNSPFYLVLDADVICAQPFSEDSLLVDDKALTDWEWKSTHKEWWQGSAEILQYKEPLKGFGMSVTPAVLSGRICKELLSHVGELYNEHWCSALLRRPIWTEFTLYCLYATRMNLMMQYHHSRPWMVRHRKALRSGHNVWFERDFQKWVPSSAFAPGSRGIFMVCQSNTQIDPDRVREKLRGFL
jgi:Family of unknown function (DUF6492)